jgi:hypothetical protein
VGRAEKEPPGVAQSPRGPAGLAASYFHRAAARPFWQVAFGSSSSRRHSLHTYTAVPAVVSSPMKTQDVDRCLHRRQMSGQSPEPEKRSARSAGWLLTSSRAGHCGRRCDGMAPASDLPLPSGQVILEVLCLPLAERHV